MESDDQAPNHEADLLTSPRFDTVATSRAHSVVPLADGAGSAPAGHRWMGMRRGPLAVVIAAAVLGAAVMVGAATLLYKPQQSTTAPVTPVSVSNDPARRLAAEEASSRRNVTPAPAPRRRANTESVTPPVRPVVISEPASGEQVLGRIREMLADRARSRGENRRERRDRGEQRRRHKRGNDRDDDDN